MTGQNGMGVQRHAATITQPMVDGGRSNHYAEWIRLTEDFLEAGCTAGRWPERCDWL